jgi:serine/threonine protein kinase, bacterial
VSCRVRLHLLYVPASLAILLAGIGQAPAASASGVSPDSMPAAASGFGSALAGSAPVGTGPSELALDPATHTIYVANGNNDNGPNAGGNTVSVIDARHCDAHDVSTCKGPWPTVTVGNLPSTIAIDQHTDTVYVTDSQTQTLYTANEVDNDVSVIDASGCNAQTTSGCRHPAPDVAISGPGALAADPAVHTTYVTSGSNTVSMIDTSDCNAGHPSGCATTPATATVGSHPNAVTVDQQTRTVYVANAGHGSPGTISVMNAATCNATDSAGCGTLATLQVPGGNPDGIAVNTATGTLYVATLTSSGPNLISVFNAATCNATRTTGCGQTPSVLKIGDSGGAQFGSALTLAMDQATNTLYATNVVMTTVPFGGDSVYVINGATCDAANTTSCGQAPAKVAVGNYPSALAADPAAGTAYITNGDNTVSVIHG